MEPPEGQAATFRRLGKYGEIGSKSYIDHALETTSTSKRSRGDAESPIDLDQPTNSSQKRRRVKNTPSRRPVILDDDEDEQRRTASQPPLAGADEGPPPLEDD